MNDWVNGDHEKPWEFLQFVADALKQGRELECLVQFQTEPEAQTDWGTAVDCSGAADYKVRARIKPRPLAPWWKKLEPGKTLSGQIFLARDDQAVTCINVDLLSDAKTDAGYWLGCGWTYYARKEDILHGCKGAGE